MKRETPGVETVGAGGGARDDPLIPCHACGTQERFMAMKRSDKWTLQYRDDGEWVAYCPDCGAPERQAEPETD